MEYDDKLGLADKLLDNLYERVFSDEGRVVSLLNVPKKSPAALIDDMSNSMRYIGLSLLRDRLQLGSMDKGVNELIDELERRSKMRMQELASKFISDKTPSMSDMIRPGRTI